MTPATATLIGAIVVAVGGLLTVVLKNNRRSPETRTALDAGWDKLTGGLERRLAALEASDRDKDQQLADQRATLEAQAQTIAGLELATAEQAASLRKIRALNAWLSNRVAQLVAFITSNELTPPPEEPRP